jgi:hypothetical protein
MGHQRARQGATVSVFGNFTAATAGKSRRVAFQSMAKT